VTDQPRINPEFVIQRSGRDFVLYAGLLDLAHRSGLVSIVTETVTTPTMMTAVFKATVTFADGRVFTGHGDATPENVGRQIVPHLIRMGETRAKARALRDALNIGAASLEELGDEEPAPVVGPARPTPTESGRSPLTTDGGAARERAATPVAPAPASRGSQPTAPAEPRLAQPVPDGAPPLTNARPAGPRWAATPLGRQVSALGDALTNAGKKFALPPDDADDAALKGWLASKKTALGQRANVRAEPAPQGAETNRS
jgi:hypothetical protein